MGFRKKKKLNHADQLHQYMLIYNYCLKKISNITWVMVKRTNKEIKEKFENSKVKIAFRMQVPGTS